MGHKKWIGAAIIGFILPAFFCLSARAQTENWDTYMAKFGDKPGSVLVNMGLKDIAPDRKFPFLVITGPRAEKCNKQGLPDKEQIDAMEEILDATNNFLTGVTAKVLAGTFTYNCERLNYYYVKDTNNIRNALMRMYNRGYANYSYAINMKYEPGWETYRTFLYPSDEIITWMENDKIITRMLQQGDDLTKQRNINFNLLFRTDSTRNVCASIAVNKGYKVTKSSSLNTPNAALGLMVTRYGHVRINAIDSMTEELKMEVRQLRGVYNGWEAPLVNKMQK